MLGSLVKNENEPDDFEAQLAGKKKSLLEADERQIVCVRGVST